jgi:hypothetical protein
MLTARKIAEVLRAGRKTRALDAAGLYLQVRGSAQASWLLRYTIDGRGREMGLGPYPRVTLLEARQKARAARAQLDRGEDPLATATVRVGGERQTLAHAAQAFFASNQSRWRIRQGQTAMVATLAPPHRRTMDGRRSQHRP